MIHLEAQLKAVDEDIYTLYLKTPKWHGNKDVIEALIESAQNYDSIFIEHEEELENAIKDRDEDSYSDGYETGYSDGKELYDNLVDKVESLIQAIELEDTKSNIELAIAQVKRECP